MTSDDETRKWWRLPGWVRELALKTLYVVVPLLMVAAANLYSDNINTKKDVSREAWRNDQQDARDNRFETNQDKLRESVADLRDDQNRFKEEVREEIIKRLDLLLEKRARRER